MNDAAEGQRLEERTERALSAEVAEEDWATVHRHTADELTVWLPGRVWTRRVR